jgi:hypothetical protein
MRHPSGLPRLSFAAGDEPVPLAKVFIRDAVAAIPKLRRNVVVHHIAKHVSPFAVVDHPKRIPSELEVVPPLVDAI